MLESDTSVSDDRKYLIFVSDGITYMYNEEPTAIGLENADKTNILPVPTTGPQSMATTLLRPAGKHISAKCRR